MRSAPKRPASTTAAVPAMSRRRSQCNARHVLAKEQSNLEYRRWMYSTASDTVRVGDKHFDWQSLRIESDSSIQT